MTGNEKPPRAAGVSQNFGGPTISSPIEKVLSRLEGIRGGNSSWTARCPGHEDKRNSLSIYEGIDGKVLLKCHAGCETENILTAIDLGMKDLFPGGGQAKKQKNEIIATYDYVDESGTLLYQAVRLNPKGFYQRRPGGNCGWINNLNDTRRVLYRLPKVMAAVAAGQTIHVVEGEKDADNLVKKLGLVATCNCGGAGKWLPEGHRNWKLYHREYSKSLQGAHVVILPDNDDPGRKHAEAVKTALEGIAADVKVIHLPGLPAKGDVSDWIAAGGTAEELKKLIENPPPEPPAKEPAAPKLSPEEARAKFPPLTTDDIVRVLGQTIKRDETNKVVTFLCCLSAFTEREQLNISFNAPSSTGKSYVPLETSSMFPEEDVIIVSYCSATGFFHDHRGTFDEKIGGYLVDLSRKILIFLDQPHTLLLQHLRPLLSHDKKELLLKITDKSQRAGLKTKNIVLRGYPAVIFCTAGLNIDEQEATRFLLLSPETTQEKIREAIYQVITKNANPDAYQNTLNADPDRQLLKERIRAIRDENIREIKIDNPEQIAQRFFSKNEVLKPRHSRDIRRIVALIKSFALLNLWHREREGNTLVTNQIDIDHAFALWDVISESQELNLPPYIYNLFKDIILKAYQEKDHGLTRGEILKEHFEVHGRMLEDWKLRKEILPMLETVGLISQEPDPADKRRVLVYPHTHSPISHEEKYRGMDRGVTEKANPEFPELPKQEKTAPEQSTLESEVETF